MHTCSQTRLNPLSPGVLDPGNYPGGASAIFWHYLQVGRVQVEAGEIMLLLFQTFLFYFIILFTRLSSYAPKNLFIINEKSAIKL